MVAPNNFERQNAVREGLNINASNSFQYFSITLLNNVG